MVKQLWHTHTMEYYSPMKRNNSTQAKTPMDLKGLTLNKQSYPQNIIPCMIPLSKQQNYRKEKADYWVTAVRDDGGKVNMPIKG